MSDLNPKNVLNHVKWCDFSTDEEDNNDNSNQFTREAEENKTESSMWIVFDSEPHYFKRPFRFVDSIFVENSVDELIVELSSIKDSQQLNFCHAFNPNTAKVFALESLQFEDVDDNYRKHLRKSERLPPIVIEQHPHLFQNKSKKNIKVKSKTKLAFPQTHIEKHQNPKLEIKNSFDLLPDSDD